MPALVALINVVGRIVVVLIEAKINVVFALGKSLSAAIRALWQEATRERHHRRPQRRSRRRRRYVSNRR